MNLGLILLPGRPTDTSARKTRVVEAPVPVEWQLIQSFPDSAAAIPPLLYGAGRAN